VSTAHPHIYTTLPDLCDLCGLPPGASAECSVALRAAYDTLTTRLAEVERERDAAQSKADAAVSMLTREVRHTNDADRDRDAALSAHDALAERLRVVEVGRDEAQAALARASAVVEAARPFADIARQAWVGNDLAYARVSDCDAVRVALAAYDAHNAAPADGEG